MALIHLNNNLAIVQGKTFQLALLWEGDLSTWAGRAKIRDNYKHEAGTEIASFSFLPFSYPVLNSAGMNCTSIVLYLSASLTETIPVTEYQGKKDDMKLGKAYVWDLELESPTGIVKGLEVAFVQVKPEVT